MFLWTGLTLLVLGVLVWFFGNRLWLLAAGAGALLGVGLLRLFPGMADGFVGFLLVAGLAIGLGVLGFLGKAFSKMIALIIGFIAGGGIALGLIDSLALDLGFWDWILALIAGGIGALLLVRFFDWGLIIIASLVGSFGSARGDDGAPAVAFRPIGHRDHRRLDGTWHLLSLPPARSKVCPFR